MALRFWEYRKRRKLAQDPAEIQTIEEERQISLTLFVVIVLYFLISQLSVFIILGFYFQFSSAGSNTMETQHTNAWWTSLFGAVSAFNDCGFFLFGTSLIPVNTQITPLIFYGALILMGNTFYPIFLRMCLRLVELILRKCGSPLAHRFKIILDQPRSFVTHVFSSKSTWRLLLIQIFLIGLQTILMVALPNGGAFAGLDDGYYFANALFQSISVRTAGLNSIPIGLLSIEALIIMIAMMYIAAYPIITSLRSSNIQQNKPKKTLEYQLRRLLMQDAMWVVGPWFLVCACEGFTNYGDGFNALFEVVSAYGTVGLSLGVSNANYSFSGSFGIASKLVIILVMLLGRHRGMPDAFDSALVQTARMDEIKTRAKSTDQSKDNQI